MIARNRNVKRHLITNSGSLTCRNVQSFMRKAIVLGMAVFLFFASGSAVYAQQRRALEMLRHEFQRRATGSGTDNTTLGWILAAFVAFLVVLAVVSWIVNRFRQRRPYFSHTLLFLELSWIHRFRYKDILFLWRWTSQEKIRPRAQVFVDPALWQNKINPVLVAAGLVVGQTDWDRLYSQLFGTFVPQNCPGQSPSGTSQERQQFS